MIVKKILKKIRFIINLIIREIMYTAMRNKNFEYTFNKNLKHLAKVAGYPPPPSDIFERIYADKEQNQAEIWNGDDCFCCFIGHSSDEMKMSKKEIMPPLRKAVKEALNDGYSVFITGMSKGFERWAANIVIEEIKKDPCIDLECIIPDRNEALNYSIKEQIEYNRIIIYSI